MPAVVEQVLASLVAQWQLMPADMLLFPPGAWGDELATRLAWRLQGESVCQITSLAADRRQVTKSHWGSALQVRLRLSGSPLCFSLANTSGAATSCRFPDALPERWITPGGLPEWLVAVDSLGQVEEHPLPGAHQVLIVGDGGENVDMKTIATLAQRLKTEVGYSRARVMRGGFDAGRLVGISGQLLSPDVCIVAGASGAAALMAGVRASRFIVAINSDASAPVFDQADVGIVDDWLPVLEALAACAEN
jgi:electron transfer flavoprotein alpha subunit